MPTKIGKSLPCVLRLQNLRGLGTYIVSFPVVSKSGEGQSSKTRQTSRRELLELQRGNLAQNGRVKTWL